MITSNSFRKNYEQGVDRFYEKNGNSYHNPHEPKLKRVFQLMLQKWGVEVVNFNRVLDLACGSGEVSAAIQTFFTARNRSVVLGPINVNDEIDPDKIYIEAADPFTHEAYEKRLGLVPQTYSFADVEGGILSDKQFDVTISSYAMHLIDQSRLFTTCQALALVSAKLIVISPHKRPEIAPSMGWTLEEEFTETKVHVKLYRSMFF